MKKLKTSIFLIFIAFSGGQAVADTAKVPCFKKGGGVGLNTLDKFQCGLAKAVSNDSKVKEEFQNKVYDKLSSKLAEKVNQRLEEIIMLDRYYEQIGLELGKNSEDVKNKCRLDVIANTACGSGASSKLLQKKMDLLMGHFPKSDKVKDDSLVSRMRAKMGKMRGVEQEKKNNCPISGNTGHFFIESQFSLAEANRFIEALKKIDGDPKSPSVRSGTSYVQGFYNKFPQFKMLKDAGKDIIKKFEEDVRKYDSSANGSSKKYIENVFLSSEYQGALAKALADKCSGISNNIKEYMCNDLDHLGMNDDFASEFLEDDDKNEEEINLGIAKGFSCGEDSVDTEKAVDFDKGSSISSWNKKFTDDTRLSPSPTDVSTSVNAFCQIYTCKVGTVTHLKSCQSGGPVKSEDLLSLCAEKDLSSCSIALQQQISFLRTLEKDEDVLKSPNQSLASGQKETTETQKAKGFSSFYTNFLGVEGTLMAEGKKITPVTVAEKQQEFTEKKLDTTNAANLSLSNQNPQAKLVGKAEPQEVMQQERPITRNDERYNSFITSQNANEEIRRAFVNSNMKLSDNATSGKVKKTESSEESDRTEEMKKLRAELADAINKVKGTEEEKLATVAENNRSILAPQDTKAETSRSSSLSSAEQARLDQYRDSLNAWESKLRSWNNDLTDREINLGSGGHGATSGSSRANSPQPSEGTGGSGDYASGNSSGFKLTKASGAVGPAAMAKGDSEATRGPASESAEVEGAAVVSSEALATLKKESLRKLGVQGLDSFIIKVRHQDKLYDVPVKTFSYKGKNIFVPLLNERNRDLSKIIYNSPLFEDYRQYQRGMENR